MTKHDNSHARPNFLEVVKHKLAVFVGLASPVENEKDPSDEEYYDITFSPGPLTPLRRHYLEGLLISTN